MAEPLFELDLFAVGEAGAGFRYDDPDTNLMVRHRSGLTIRAGLDREIQFKTDSGYETLLIITFKFISPSAKNRFREAKITLSFRNNDNKPGIEIADFSPKENNYINATPRKVKKGLTLGLNFWMVTPIGPAAGRPIDLTSESEVQVTDMGRITGARWPDGERSNEEDNVAFFTLSENDNQKQGIPSHFTVALVVRTKIKSFTMDAEIEAKAGVIYNLRDSVEDLMGIIPRNKCIVFPKARQHVLTRWEKEHGEIKDMEKLKEVALKDFIEIQEAPLLSVETEKKGERNKEVA